MVKCDLCEADEAEYICYECEANICPTCRRHHECFINATAYTLHGLYKQIK